MILPLHDTPLDAPVRRPPLREGAWDPALEAAIVPAPGVEPVLARLRTPGALVVTTGQQAGLFTGPAYAVTKALSARALALALERQHRRPVVPLFWVPGDDHDFDEVASVAWLGGEGELTRAALPPRPPDAPLVPMARLPLGEGVLAALDTFEQSFPDAATRADAVAWLRRHYRPGATVAGAYAGALAELLAPWGVLCFDSTHPAAKRAMAAPLLAALRAAGPLDTELAARAAALAAAGADPNVTVGDGAALGFLEGAVGRDRLVVQGGGFVTRRGRVAVGLAELERIAATEPGRLSGNVLLRPVLEAAILPTQAYVAGPGELRYLPLAAPVYAQLGITAQCPVPRWSGLVVEPRVGRVLAKHGAALEELLAEGPGLEDRITRLALPAGAEAAFAALRAAIESAYGPVLGAAARVDPTLERPAAAARGRALQGAGALEKKVLRHARRRIAVELAQLARARLAVRPEGKPQERVLSMAGYLARYGMTFLEPLAAHIEGWYRRALEGAPPTP